MFENACLQKLGGFKIGSYYTVSIVLKGSPVGYFIICCPIYYNIWCINRPTIKCITIGNKLIIFVKVVEFMILTYIYIPFIFIGKTSINT